MDKERYRVRWLDIARVFAIISVVNMHVTQEIFSYDLQIVLQDSRMEQIIKMCLFTFGRMGVPIFLFITGYLMLDREYDYEKSTDFLRIIYWGWWYQLKSGRLFMLCLVIYILRGQ